jgi:hypothetical protein
MTCTYSLATIVAMWKYRSYVKYLAWHLVWILLTVVTYAPMPLVHIIALFGVESCSFRYVKSTQSSMMFAASSGFFPALVRLLDKRLRERLRATFGRSPASSVESSLNFKDWNEDSSFLVAEMPMNSFSRMNYAGVFKSLSAKVRPTQFIVDSVSALTFVFNSKIDSVQGSEHESLGKKSGSISVRHHEACYDIRLNNNYIRGSVLENYIHLSEETVRVVEYLPEEFQSLRDTDGISSHEILT